MMKKPFLIVANWKANLTVAESVAWVKEFKDKVVEAKMAAGLEMVKKIKIILSPAYPAIPLLQRQLLNVKDQWSIVLASQDISSFDNGPYTGEVNAKLLSGYVEYCLVGHSERRKNFGENTTMVARKMEQAIKYGIIPIICAQDINEIPGEIKNYSNRQIAIMFEPAAAISQAGQYHAESTQVISAKINEWRNKLRLDCPFLYGGSVNAENVESLLKTGVDGLVVGDASLKVESFIKIIKQINSR